MTSNQVMYKDSRSVEAEKYVIDEMLVELARARGRYPTWPTDLIHAMVVVQEESGEILKAANEVYWGHKATTIEDVRKEAIQTMAMCMRFLTETPGLAIGTELTPVEPIPDMESKQ